MSIGDDDSESNQATLRIALLRVVMEPSVPAARDMRQQWIAKCAAEGPVDRQSPCPLEKRGFNVESRQNSMLQLTRLLTHHTRKTLPGLMT